MDQEFLYQPKLSESLFLQCFTPQEYNGGYSSAATCTSKSAGKEGTDDVPAIVEAIKTCGKGGIIVLSAEQTYSIRSTLEFTGCSNCDFQIEGTMKVSNDLDYWGGKKAIINVGSITGAKIHSVTGSGLIDGNGQAAWDRFASDSSYGRPTLMVITKSSGITVDKLRFVNAPNVFHSTGSGSTNIVYTNIDLSAKSSSSKPPKNTDGWDIGASHITMANLHVQNDDDCVAFKPGADYVDVRNVTCIGSHGLSVGSLGKTNLDTVSNIYVKGATMKDSTKAVGIKYYPSGYGDAVVKNVTYEDITVDNSDYAIQIQSCYNEEADYCASHPSEAQLEGIHFNNFKGTTSKNYKGTVANINCSNKDECDVHVKSFSVKSAGGTAAVLCAHTPRDIGVTCASGANGRLNKTRLSTLNAVTLCLSYLNSFVDGQSLSKGALPTRPNPVPYPYNHGRPHPISPPRDAARICYVTAAGNGEDDSQAILSAAKTCNKGGTIALLDAAYTVGNPLDLTFLDSVDFVIQGTLSFTPDIDFWVENTFKYTYQTASLFWQFGGRDVNIYGGGTINGNGQAWWDTWAEDNTVMRPTLFGVIGLKGGAISNLKLINTPNWFHLVANSSDIIFDNMNLKVASTSANPVKNSGKFSKKLISGCTLKLSFISDDWDTYRSDSITIQNSYVSNTDDCVSFKPNSTNIVVQNMECINSHGISVGSLGQYVAQRDILENIYGYNVSMKTSGDGARIKVWSGVAPGSTVKDAGGGVGYVRNVTYNGMHNTKVDYAIELTQCYSQKN
ncbi:hypothetical protein HYALB_00005023 [Hymenoscyphus albidus]|uniref:Glycoside hydrolase family 28 protein n=1 Tax=Hymenoscyphus albidus TaxID=595503 RepID=A0A9N9LFS5_9HELO|nr:hypothetical protein HYALB_00005023 [Hymenoscyphus albidus]